MDCTSRFPSVLSVTPGTNAIAFARRWPCTARPSKGGGPGRSSFEARKGSRLRMTDNMLQSNSSRSSGFGCLQPKAALGSLAHHELLDFSGDRHRKLVDEFDVTRNLVVGDLSLAEQADFFRAEGFAGTHPDPGAELFAISIIRNAEDLHVLDLWMPIQEFLDLPRIQVLAAANHHVLDAADDVAIALVVDHAEVAGVHPAAGVDHVGGPFRIAPVAEHDAVATGA